MMDATYTSVLRIWEQCQSCKEIERRLNLSHSKITQILVTAGAIETEESKLFAAGYTVEEIAQKLQKSRKAVLCRIPYQKGMYNAEYPSRNAIRIRKCRTKE